MKTTEITKNLQTETVNLEYTNLVDAVKTAENRIEIASTISGNNYKISAIIVNDDAITVYYS